MLKLKRGRRCGSEKLDPERKAVEVEGGYYHVRNNFNITLNEIGQVVKDKYHMISPVGGI